MASSIDEISAPTTLTSGSYLRYLEDAQKLIAQDPSFQRYLRTENVTDIRPPYKDPIPRHRLDLTCTIFPVITSSLADFFFHSPAHNLALTAILVSLAACAYRSLEPWLLPSAMPVLMTSSDQAIPPFLPMADSENGAIIAIIRELVGQIKHYRHSIENFDRYLAERRQGLMFVDNLADALDQNDFGIQDLSSDHKLSPTTSFREDFLRPSASAGGDPVSPFASHYRQTGAISVVPLSVATVRPPEVSSRDTLPEDEVGKSSALSRTNTPLSVSLSTLLDNVVVLEEAIKELVAIIHCRRSLGIDSIV